MARRSSRHALRDSVPAPRATTETRPGRHLAEPVRRPDAVHEATQPLQSVDARRDGLAATGLPFPETSGLLIRHPGSGALAVSCNTRGHDTPEAERYPCYAVRRPRPPALTSPGPGRTPDPPRPGPAHPLSTPGAPP